MDIEIAHQAKLQDISEIAKKLKVEKYLESYGKNKDKFKMVTYIDGPFFPKDWLSLQEQKHDLRNQVYNCMVERSKDSNIEIIEYKKKE